MEVEEHRSWSTLTSTSDSEKEEPLQGRSSRKLDDVENVDPTLSFNGHAKTPLLPEKADEIVLITTATDKSVVFDKKQGGGFKHLLSDSGEPNDVQGHIFGKNYGDEVFSPITKELDPQRSPFHEINDQNEESHKDSSTSELLPQPSEESSSGFIVEKSSPEIIAVNDDTDYEETEYDVETVLEKQNSHDLYCPNCRSCITRRVILCKRKRTAKSPRDLIPKKPRPEADLDVDPTGNQGGKPLDTILEGGPASAETEVFRCLSCFSFFIPSGFRGSRILPSGEKTETENIEKSNTISVSKKHWWEFMFHFDKDQTLETGRNKDLQTSDILRPLLISPPSDSSSTPTNGEIDKTDFQNEMVGDANLEKKPDGVIDNDRESDPKPNIFTHTEYHAENTEAKQPEDGVKIIVPEFNTYNPLVIEENIEGMNPKLAGEQVLDGKNFIPAVEDGTFLNKNNTKSSSETILVIEDQPIEHVVPPDVIDVPLTGDTLQTTHTRDVSGLEIVKSIVYGGLIESITSLGIVSSAAGADATTLNILALSIANLIGGFFLIIHNIWDLKAEHDANTSTRRRGRYQEILGRRQNFWVHATCALLSFVVFGLVPPVIYGFSFRESDDKDFKLIAVAGGSLLCIILLAIGRAYVQKLAAKDYVKTLLYYVSSGFMASGISYVAGKLVKKLLEDLGLFESTEALNLSSIIQTMPTGTPWKSFY